MNSFPIEVALAGMDGNVHSWLIKPIPSWRKCGEWNKQSEAIHGLSLPFLEAQGLAPMDVAAEVQAMAGEALVLSDNVVNDSQWLQKLFFKKTSGFSAS